METAKDCRRKEEAGRIGWAALWEEPVDGSVPVLVVVVGANERFVQAGFFDEVGEDAGRGAGLDKGVDSVHWR